MVSDLVLDIGAQFAFLTHFHSLITTTCFRFTDCLQLKAAMGGYKIYPNSNQCWPTNNPRRLNISKCSQADIDMAVFQTTLCAVFRLTAVTEPIYAC